jgi:probable rRNA maturation factor
MSPHERHRIELVDAPDDVSPRSIIAVAGKVLERLRKNPVAVSIAFVDDRRMRELNRTYRQKDATTDVLSFMFGDDTPEGEHYLGEIVIAVPTATRQAQELGHTLQAEILQLVTHGLLHLCGYDHETDDGKMDDLELTMRREIVDQYC